MPNENNEERTEKNLSGSYSKMEALAKQVDAEYGRAWRHQKPRKAEMERRLKLYNNQRRDKKAVGDTTLFTVLQTVFASLYDDRLMATFTGREEGDEETGENLTAMAKFDYAEMEKDELDLTWIWDMLFCGRGLIAMSEYKRDPDKGIFVPQPENIDFIPFLRDPLAQSINGDSKGRKASRFHGSEIIMSAEEIEMLPDRTEEFTMSELSTTSTTYSLLKNAIDARDLAQNRQSQTMEGEADLGVNAGYPVTRWYTHFKINGEIKKVKIWLANERSKVVGFQVLKNDYWEMVDRPLYPTSYDWDGTSIPDLVEDKQRARAVILNMALDALKADLYTMYAYDSNKITNRRDLKFGFNKAIPIDNKDGGRLENALMPLRKALPNMGLTDFVLTTIDISAQKATATPDIQQGIQSDKDRPLGETNLIASRVDTRYSLSAKVLGMSEKRFWRLYYRLYKEHFADNIDEKIIRIKGSFGIKWRGLGRENIIALVDPDIEIESRNVNRAKQLEERSGLIQYFGLAFQEPGANRMYGLRLLGKKYGMDKDQIDRLYPPTIDEREARDENKLLNDDKLAEVLREQNHNVHLLEHTSARDTAATRSHIKAHEEALSFKREAPELFPEDEGETAFTPPGQENILPPTATPPQPVAPSQTS